MRIAMVTANYFGKASNYQTSMNDWGAAERRVIESASLREFDDLCNDIERAGFKYLELWMGHAFPKFMTPDLAGEMKQICENHHLTMSGYSCSLGDPVQFPRWTRLCFETCRMLGIPLISSGLSKEAAPTVSSYCREYGIKVAVENHPERHPSEIQNVIGDDGDCLGACVDTGWFATQGYHAADAIRHLHGQLLNIHLKDVKARGTHESTKLGTGIADIASCIRAIKDIGYNGNLSIEQESGDHDPTEDCAEGLGWLRQEFPAAL